MTRTPRGAAKNLRPTAWPPPRLAELARLWAAGLPASEIARRLGTTRGSIFGAVWRYDIPQRPPTAGRPRTAPRCKAPTGPPVAAPTGGTLPSPPPAKPLPAPPAPALATLLSPAEPYGPPDYVPLPPSAAALAVFNLRPNHCRWPDGDPTSPSFRFCCAERQPPYPYCPTHLAGARRAPQPR